MCGPPTRFSPSVAVVFRVAICPCFQVSTTEVTASSSSCYVKSALTLSRRYTQKNLDDFFDGIGALLKRSEQRAHFALYAMGLLSTLERKSLEPIAELGSDGDPKICEALHHALIHFSNTSPWSDDAVRSYATNYALPHLLSLEPLDVWIIDDTGFLKQGKHSVGVQRQYTGTAGKITNCQIAVSLTAATRMEHLPVDFQLYLPQEWADDKERRKVAKIPDTVSFNVKVDIALAMLGAALKKGLPKATVAADSFYGSDKYFRGEITELGLQYSVGVHENLKVHRVMPDGLSNPMTVKELALSLGRKRFKNVTWKEGTKEELASRFARARVRIVKPDCREPEEQTLLVEWPTEANEPTHYTLLTLDPETTLKEMVRKTKARWHIERSYEDMKGELGLDHFEGRSWIGWHHHISVVLACYSLVQACKWRAFSPSEAGQSATGANRPQASATLC